MNLGDLKARYQRIITYITAINFLMLFYNFQYVNDWMPWYGWIVLFVLVLGGVSWFDSHHVWENETTVTAKKNRVLMENNRLLKEILKRLQHDDK